LVEGDDGSETHHIGHGADGFGVLESTGSN